MSALTHLAAADRQWAAKFAAQYLYCECGRQHSTEAAQRDGAAREAADWLRGMDPEQAAANAGFRVIQCGSPTCDNDPLGAKRAAPPVA